MIAKIATNTLFLSFSQIGARFLGFLYFIFLARYLGVATFGVYNFTIAFIYNFVPLADFGLERLILRDLSRDLRKTNDYLARLIPLKTILSLVAYFMALGLALILGQSFKQIIYLAIFGLFIFPYNFNSLLSTIQNAREKMKYFSLVIIFGQLFTVIIGTIFIFFHLSLYLIFLAPFLGNMLISLILIAQSSKWNLKLAWKFDKKFCQEILSQSWAFAVILILAVVYLRISLILVGMFKGDYYVGLYSSVFKFVEALILVPQSLALALFPLTSRLFIDDKKKLQELYLKTLTILFLIALPVATIFIIFPDLIISLAYGSSYLPVVPVLTILGVSLIFFFLNSLPGNIIQNSQEYKKFIPWAILNLAITLVAGLFLIPRFSIIGAAWTVLIGETCGFFINNLFVWKILKK